jgi:NMT1-like family
MDRRGLLLGTIGASALALMGHSPYRKWSQYRARHAVIATDRADTGSFPLGERLAQRLAERRPDLAAVAARSENARTLVSLLRTRQVDLALLRAEDAYQGMLGTGPYAALATPLQVLATLAPEYLYIVVPAGSSVRVVSDLKRQRVGVTDTGRARVKAERVAAAYGLDPEAELEWQPVALADGLSSTSARLVAAWCLEGPLAQFAPVTVEAPPGFSHRLIQHGDAVPALAARYGPIYFRAVLPTKGDTDVGRGVDVLGEARLLVCREDYPLERGHMIAEALAGWEGLAPPGTPRPIPAHPGFPAG